MPGWVYPRCYPVREKIIKDKGDYFSPQEFIDCIEIDLSFFINLRKTNSSLTKIFALKRVTEITVDFNFKVKSYWKVLM
jgi:hypothetical protein